MMRRAAVVLALLLCLQWTWAQAESQTNPDIWAELKALRQENTDLLARLTASENKMTALEAKMSSSVNEVEEMKRVNADPPKVAFSASLGVGAESTDPILKFITVLTNIGQAYNRDTGIFTAPVSGAYFFRFTLWSTRTLASIGASLHHNHKCVMTNSDYNDDYAYASLSNGIVLQLEQGDEVFMTPRSSLSDNPDNRTTFSGFLLFPL